MRILQATAACLLTVVTLPAQTLTPREVFYGETAPAPTKAPEQKRPKTEAKPKVWSEKSGAAPGKIAASPAKVEAAQPNVPELGEHLGVAADAQQDKGFGRDADLQGPLPVHARPARRGAQHDV